MNIDNPKGTESSVSTKKNVRRTFLKRASATAVVGALPAKSVWATGVANSIVASNHGSDFALGRPIKLLSPCAILDLLNDETAAGLNLNFLTEFGQGPDQTFSEILDCHCTCASTENLPNAISNVVFRVETSPGVFELIKVDNYVAGHGEIKNPNDPTRYYDYIESNYGSVVEYVIKAGPKYYIQSGAEVQLGYGGWYQGPSNVNSFFNANSTDGGGSVSGPGSNCEGTDETLAMIAIYLNARFDLYFRQVNGYTNEQWASMHGMHDIYYPILTPSADVNNLVASINGTTGANLISILTEYGSGIDTPTC